MAVSWTVTGQLADQTDVTTSGQVVTGHIVYFITGEGNRGSVFIPNDHFRPDAVKTLVAAQAKLVDEVGNLSGTT